MKVSLRPVILCIINVSLKLDDNQQKINFPRTKSETVNIIRVRMILFKFPILRHT